MLLQTTAQKAKSYRLRATKMKQLAKRLPEKSDQQALLGLAAQFVQQADELERAPRIGRSTSDCQTA